MTLVTYWSELLAEGGGSRIPKIQQTSFVHGPQNIYSSLLDNAGDNSAAHVCVMILFLGIKAALSYQWYASVDVFNLYGLWHILFYKAIIGNKLSKKFR